METTLGRCILLLLGVSYCRPTSAPSYCSFIETEAYFECDYSKMANPADRPIDFNSFDPVPQRLTVYVNGFLPYAGKCISHYSEPSLQRAFVPRDVAIKMNLLL